MSVMWLKLFYISALKRGINDRDLALLEKSVKEAEDKKLEPRLGLQLAMAKQILEKLQRLEKLKKEILNLDQKTIAEIKSYSQPPKQVHQVMSAAFVLLGDKLEAVKVRIYIIGYLITPLTFTTRI